MAIIWSPDHYFLNFSINCSTNMFLLVSWTYARHCGQSVYFPSQLSRHFLQNVCMQGIQAVGIVIRFVHMTHSNSSGIAAVGFLSSVFDFCWSLSLLLACFWFSWGYLCFSSSCYFFFFSSSLFLLLMFVIVSKIVLALGEWQVNVSCSYGHL